jgi:hypothetical protein
LQEYEVPIIVCGKLSLHYEEKDGKTDAVITVTFEPIIFHDFPDLQAQLPTKPINHAIRGSVANFKLPDLDPGIWAQLTAANIAFTLQTAAASIARMALMSNALVIGLKPRVKTWLDDSIKQLAKHLRAVFGERVRPGPKGVILGLNHITAAITRMAREFSPDAPIEWMKNADRLDIARRLGTSLRNFERTLQREGKTWQQVKARAIRDHREFEKKLRNLKEQAKKKSEERSPG